jgi:signal transduction histidine kinase
MVQAFDIILKESYRLQELPLTLYGKRKESIIDLNDVVKRQFLICQETIKELKLDNIQFVQQESESPLWIRCFPLRVERVIDNLLSNACNATPEEGEGMVSVRTCPKDLWAVVEIVNTGEISDEEINRYIKGETKGRGLRICYQLVSQ